VINHGSLTIIDCQEDSDFEKGHVMSAISIPPPVQPEMLLEMQGRGAKAIETLMPLILEEHSKRRKAKWLSMMPMEDERFQKASKAISLRKYRTVIFCQRNTWSECLLKAFKLEGLVEDCVS
jgi:hypothetical protein